MPRLFRLWEKKRGDRRTGSKLLGAVGEALFWGVLFWLGASGLAGLLTYRVAAATGNPQSAIGNPQFGDWAFWSGALVAAALLITGGVGVALTVSQAIASPERRKALARRAADIELISGALPSSKDYPSIPRETHLTNSPGAWLAYRLPTIRSPVGPLLAATVFCLAWNAVAAMLAVWAVESVLAGEPDWLLVSFAVVCVGIGVRAIYFFVRQLHLHAGVGATLVEVSSLPFYPGRQYEVVLAQAGDLTFESLELSLVCDEEATFRQGTDVRTETCRVVRQSVFREEQLRIEPEAPLVRREQLTVPAEAMHSFQANHNALRWKLLVEGRLPFPHPGNPHAGAGTRGAQPRFERAFPVLVYPAPFREDRP